MPTDPASCLPLTEPTFYILLSLVSGRKHGYAILKDIEELSQGKVNLSTSTLYSALGRLLDQGLIKRVPDIAEEGPNPGLPRKAYVLSESGRRVLEMDIGRLQDRAVTARLRLHREGI